MVRKQWRSKGIRTRLWVSFVVAVLAAAALAGCVADEEAVAPGSETGNSGGRGGTAGPDGEGVDVAPAHRFADAQPVDLQVDETGTFGLGEYCMPVNCLIYTDTGEGPHEVVVDLGEQIPVGVPATIELRLEYDQEHMGGLTLRVETGDVRIFHSESHWEFGEQDMQIMLMREEAASQVHFVVEANTPGPPAETTWSLTGSVVADPLWIPSGVPVLVPSENGADGFRVTTADGEASYRLWDSDHAFLGDFETEDQMASHTFESRAGEGTILMLAPDSPAVQINATGPDPRAGGLQSVSLAWEPVGDPHVPDQQGTVEWTFDLEDVPVSVGLGLVSDGLYLDTYAELQLSSPEEVVLQGEVVCGLCLSLTTESTLRQMWMAEPGQSALVAGTYTARVDQDLSGDHEYQGYVVSFEP